MVQGERSEALRRLWPHLIGHDVQQAIQVVDQSLHGGLGVLHGEAGEGPATVIEGEVSALRGEAGAGERVLGAGSLGTPPGLCKGVKSSS